MQGDKSVATNTGRQTGRAGNKHTRHNAQITLAGQRVFQTGANLEKKQKKSNPYGLCRPSSGARWLRG